jgi:hypothetical protein
MFDRDLSIDTADELLKAHGSRLRSLIGRTIDATWVAWDAEGDEWFPDEAVILDVGETSLEIVCWKLSDIVLSWNAIDKHQPPAWVGEWSRHLAWRRDAHPVLQGALGKRIAAINVVEYLHQTTVIDDRMNPSNIGRQDESWLLVGLELELEGCTLSVFNALDENGLALEPFVGEGYRRLPV